MTMASAAGLGGGHWAGGMRCAGADVQARGFSFGFSRCELSLSQQRFFVLLHGTRAAPVFRRMADLKAQRTHPRPFALCSFLLRHAFSAPGPTARAGIQQPAGRWG